MELATAGSYEEITMVLLSLSQAFYTRYIS